MKNETRVFPAKWLASLLVIAKIGRMVKVGGNGIKNGGMALSRRIGGLEKPINGWRAVLGVWRESAQNGTMAVDHVWALLSWAVDLI